MSEHKRWCAIVFCLTMLSPILGLLGLAVVLLSEDD